MAFIFKGHPTTTMDDENKVDAPVEETTEEVAAVEEAPVAEEGTEEAAA